MFKPGNLLLQLRKPANLQVNGFTPVEVHDNRNNG